MTDSRRTGNSGSYDPRSSRSSRIDSSFQDGDEIPEDPRIIEVVQAYMAELDRGGRPDRNAYVNRYPELASAVSLCLDGLELVRDNIPVLSRSGSSRTPLHAGELPPNPLGDFKILRELARGGMGVVYEAVQLSLGRRVALKVLPFAATFDARQLQRFKNEAQAAALLHHTNIVPIYAVGCERGVHFYAMQLIDGQSLAAVIRQLREKSGLPGAIAAGSSWLLVDSPSLTQDVPKGGSENRSGEGSVPSAQDAGAGRPAGAANHSTADVTNSLTDGVSLSSAAYFRRVARLMGQAADALEHAHQLGVVHRDIKPANLLVNSAGTLWVTDFGLAQLQADTGLTRSGDVLGTFRYMSPEQTTGQRTALDHRADIYSLGVTFYELLTLEPAFDGETRQALLYQIVTKEPRPPRSVNPAVPIELETIVLKAMSKNRAERYATAAEFAADIQRYLNHQPILARRPTLVDRVRKWSRRHPSVVVAGVILLAVIAIGMSISNRLISQEQHKTAQALEGERLRANEADARFRQARQAVDVLIQMSEEELADVPMAQGTRKRLLESAVSFYQEFIEQQRGDPASQAELAAVQDRVRGILRELTVLQREMQMGLLTNPTVQDDLGLDTQQRDQVASLQRSNGDQRETILRETRNGSDVRRRRLVELAEQREEALSQLISETQLQRLRQIGIQSQGLFAFKDPDIIRALGLTAEQRLAVREVEGEVFGSPFGPGRGPGGPDQHGPGRGPGPDDRPRGEGFGRPPEERNDRPAEQSGDNRKDRGPGRVRVGEGPGGFGEMRWRPHLNRRESIEKILAFLTDEQRQKWRGLTGEPYRGLDEPPNRGPRPRDRDQ